MLADLHAHYPMHVVDDEAHASVPLRRWRRESWRVALVDLASRVANYEGPNDTPSVTMELIRAGDVGIVFSVLYCPFDEIDLGVASGAGPGAQAPRNLLDQLERVEAQIERHHADVAVVVRSRDDLDRALEQRRTAMVHAVEGGCLLGADDEQVRATVATLAGRGVAYVTLAHLFWRGVATNAPALPFLSDRWYNLLFRQPQREGLSELGRVAVDALVDQRVLIDLTHMSKRSIDDTLDRLDGNPAARDVPVIVSHGACDFGQGLAYNLGREAIVRIAGRGGVIALIDCGHYLGQGRRGRPTTLGASLDLLCRHVDHIAELTGGFDHVAFGSDLDGYIKPALPGLTHLGAMRELQRHLLARYGPAAAEKVCHGNALRMLRYRFP